MRYTIHRYTKEQVENQLKLPDWLKYTEDTFETSNLYKWEWNHDGHQFRLKFIYIYCPYDRCLIVGNNCPVCHEWFFTSVLKEEVITARIQHKIDNDLWQEVVKTYPIKRERPEKDDNDSKPAGPFTRTSKDADDYGT